MIGFRLKCWHIDKNCQHYLIMFIRIHLFYLMIIFGLFQSSTGLTGIEFNVDANNIAAVNSQMRKKTNDHPEFSVIINEEAILPCNISAPTKEDSVALILWYRAGGKNAIYTVDARYTSSLEKAKHFSSLALKGRVTLDCGFGNLTKENQIIKSPKEKNKKQINNIKKMKGFIDSSIKTEIERQCFLKIKPVQLDDGMVDYRCRVDFKRGRTINYNMFLNLIVPSTKIEIYAEEKNTLTLLNDNSITVVEDDILNLTCISAGGNPSPSVTWWDEYKLIDDSYERVLSPQANKVVNSLLLGPFNKNYLDKKYTCKVSNNNLSLPIEKTISLNVDLKPKNLIIEPKPETIMAKEKLKLVCKCLNGKSPTRLIWLKDENLIDEQLIENKITSDNTLVSILTWIVTPEDNEKKITCRSINSKFKNFVIEDSFILNIQFAPFVSLVFGSSNRNEELLEGSDIFFECNFQSNPVVKKVKWIFNDQLLIDSKQESFKKSKKDEKFFNSKNFNTHELKKELNNSYSNQILENDNFSSSKKNKFATNKQSNFIDDKSLEMSFLKLPNISISSRSLLLKSATNIHSGQYQCIASNEIGIGKSDIIPLQFQFAPRCSENQPLEYLLKNSQSTDIGCEVEADPAEVTFHWLLLSGTGELTSQNILNTIHESYQNKQSTVAPYTTFDHHHQNQQNSISNSKLFSNLSSPNINFSFEYTYQNNSISNTSIFWQHGQSKTASSNMPIRIKSLAKYTPTQNTHYGVLQCWASNAIGVQKQPCTFYVLAAKVPEPPSNCSTTNITYNTLTLECIPGYSGGLPQNFHLEVYTKQNENYKNNYESNSILNETNANKFLSNISTKNDTKNSSTLFLIKKMINGQEMILLHNLTIEGYPFFSVNKLPPGNSFYLITYASNTRGVSKQVEIVANTLTAQRWQTDVLVNYLEQNAINSSALLYFIIFSFTTITILIIIVILKNRITKKIKNDSAESNQNLKETTPSNLCLSLDIANSDFQILSHNQFSSNSENCQDSFHHPILNYSTIHSTYSIPNDCHINSSQTYSCDNCKNNCNQCNNFLPTCLNTNSGEITLESLDDNVISSRRTIPVSIILPQDETQNQMSLFHQINSPLSCRHLSTNTFENQNNSYFNIPINHSNENSIDHSSLSTSSTEKKNRVFFIQTSDNDKNNFNQTNQGKVKILDLACDNSTIDSNQLNYYKLLNYNPAFDSPLDNTLNNHFENSELNYLTQNHIHNQILNSNDMNDLDKTFNKTKELNDNVELLDTNIDINQSLNNKSWIVIDQGKEKNQALTSV